MKALILTLVALKALIITLAALPLQASAATPPVRWNGSSEIQFSGTSTLHEWGGKVAAQPFTVMVTPDASGQPSSLEATVQVKVAGMDTAEPDRDKNLRKAMNATGFPLITGTLNAPFSSLVDAHTKQPAALPLTLELLGRKQSVPARISHWEATDRAATFDLDFDLSLKKCGITVPTVLFIIHVGDAIKLHATVKLVRSND